MLFPNKYKSSVILLLSVYLTFPILIIQVSEQLACGSCGSTAAAGTPYPDPNAAGGVHGVLCEGIIVYMNSRHTRTQLNVMYKKV